MPRSKLKRPPPISPSNKSFGLVMSCFFALLWARSCFKANQLQVQYWLPIAGIFLFLALFAPKLLGTANKLWMAFGGLMQKIVTPIIMGIIFFGMFTPFAFFMRLAGKDPLKRQLNPKANTYWVARENARLESESLRNQF